MEFVKKSVQYDNFGETDMFIKVNSTNVLLCMCCNKLMPALRYILCVATSCAHEKKFFISVSKMTYFQAWLQLYDIISYTPLAYSYYIEMYWFSTLLTNDEYQNNWITVV